MKMNDADYFSWVASHLWQIQYGLGGMTVKYIDKKGAYSEYYYNYSLNGIKNIGDIEDTELLRRVIDKIIERETSPTNHAP